MTRQQHGGNVWRAAETYGISWQELVDFSANINPLGPSPKIHAALNRAADKIIYYPEPQACSLRRTIGELRGIQEEAILVGNGAAEIIYALGRVLKPDRLVFPVPTFGEYAQGLGAKEIYQYKLIREQDFFLNVEELSRRVLPGDLVVICNPNNPTGQLVEKKQLIGLLNRVCELGAWLLVDEAFMDFVVPEHTLLSEAAVTSGLFVLRSLTKFYAIPGLRLGYLVSNPQIIDKLTDVLPPWRVNIMAQEVGLASLADEDYAKRTLEFIYDQREFLYQELKNIPGLYPFKPQANFILADSSETGFSAKEIQEYLGPKGILIRICDNFVGLNHHYFRVAVRKERENKIIIEQLRLLLSPSRHY